MKTESGIIHSRIKNQDGSFRPVKFPNSIDNRMFVAWMEAREQELQPKDCQA